MAHSPKFTIVEDTLLAAGAQTASFTSPIERRVSSARTVEVWLDVTVVTGASASLELIVETSIDDISTATKIFEEQGRFAGVTAADVKTLVINRADNALGKTIRVRGLITGTTPSFTMSVRMGMME